MTPSLPKTLAAVQKLNHEGQPFSYVAKTTKIVGTWAEGGATHTLVVTLDEDDGTFSYIEKTKAGKGQPAPTFDTEQMKNPLFGFLVKHGWEHPEEQMLGSRWVVR